MKYLYKYPQAAFPYNELIETNKGRNRGDMEYELLDTGVFNEDRYFDVFVEYAKETPEDLLIQISITNRGPDSATLHVLPTLWFRNTWTWLPGTAKPSLKQIISRSDVKAVSVSHVDLGERYMYCEGRCPAVVPRKKMRQTTERIFGRANASLYVKDGINNYVVNGNVDAINPKNMGTKTSANYQLNVDAGKTVVVRLRLSDAAPAPIGDPFKSFARTMQTRQHEADEFYKSITPTRVTEG